MRRHWTTARRVLLLLLALGSSAGLASARPPKAVKIVFPVLGGNAHYSDDFGAPRAGGRHQGIDILATKRSLALAAEAGTVKFWTTSASAGCMLYLHGASGTTYLYIHLNNDLTPRNDNRGKCVPGTAYAPGLHDGSKVATGQPVGFVGDSGDANGIHAHLHFELHPAGGRAVDPYPYLRAAQRLLFTAPAGAPVQLDLRGTVVQATDSALQLRLGDLTAWPMGLRQSHLGRTILVDVESSAIIRRTPAKGAKPRPATLASARKGDAVKVATELVTASLPVERGDDLALPASTVDLGPPALPGKK